MQENAEDTSLNFLSSIQKLNLVYSCHSMYYKGYWLCIAINKVMTRFEFLRIEFGQYSDWLVRS